MSDCLACDTYKSTLLAMKDQWESASEAEQPELSDQIRRAAVMYGEHVMARHLGGAA